MFAFKLSAKRHCSTLSVNPKYIRLIRVQKLLLQAFLNCRLDCIEYFCFDCILCDAYGALDRYTIGATMSDEHKSIHAEQRRRALFAGIKHLLNGTQRGSDERTAEFCR